MTPSKLRSWLLMTLALLLVGTSALAFDDKLEIPKKIGPVGIYTTINDDFIPGYWRNDKSIKAEAKAAHRKDQLRMMPLIRQFVADYPPKVLEKNLKGIYICQQLKAYGKEFGGTNSIDGVYISTGSPKDGWSDTFLLASIHHEFSSILMRNYHFPSEQWEKLLPKDFKYGGDPVAVLGQDDLLEPDQKLMAEGFICKYSQATMEEDFNTIADYLFSERPKLLKWAEKHPKLKSKVQLTMKFYRSIDTGFKFGELEVLNQEKK